MLATGFMALALAASPTGTTPPDALGVWVLATVAGKPLPRYDRPVPSLIEFEAEERFGGCATALSFDAKARLSDGELRLRDLRFGPSCIPNQPGFRSEEQIVFRQVLEACETDGCQATLQKKTLSIRSKAGDRLTFKRFAPVSE